MCLIHLDVFFKQYQTYFVRIYCLSPTFLKAWIYISHISLSGGFGPRLKIGFCIIVSGFNILVSFLFQHNFLCCLFNMTNGYFPPLCLRVNKFKKKYCGQNTYPFYFVLSFNVFSKKGCLDRKKKGS